MCVYITILASNSVTIFGQMAKHTTWSHLDLHTATMDYVYIFNAECALFVFLPTKQKREKTTCKESYEAATAKTPVVCDGEKI